MSNIPFLISAEHIYEYLEEREGPILARASTRFVRFVIDERKYLW